MIVVGTSEHWHEYERAHGLCHECSGTGELAVTGRAAYLPWAYPDELITCTVCKGTGKQT